MTLRCEIYELGALCFVSVEREFVLTGKRTFPVDVYKISLLTSIVPISEQQARAVLDKNKWDYKASLAAAAALAYNS